MKRRIGILELVGVPAVTNWGHRWNKAFATRYASVMPQAVACWLEDAGYEVDYRIYCGVGPLEQFLPNDCDTVFIACTGRTSGLARKASNLLRGRPGRRPLWNLKIVACGPHAASSPMKSIAYWADVIVKSCDREAVLEIVAGGGDYEFFLWDVPFDIDELPSLERRAKFVHKTFGTRFRSWQLVPMLASVGCPNACDFCTEHDRKYSPLSMERVKEDLQYAEKQFRGRMVAWHDPNWGIRAGRYLDAITPGKNSHVVEMELRHATEEKMLLRLREKRIKFVACGIESFRNYGNKLGISATGMDRAWHVVEELRTLQQSVPYVQANFLVGADGESRADWDLLCWSIKQTPGVWWNITPVYAFPGTPMHQRLLKEERSPSILPPCFACTPLLMRRLKDAEGNFVLPSLFYRRLRSVYSLQVSESNKADTMMRKIYLRVRRTHAMDSIALLDDFLAHSDVLDAFYEDDGRRALPEVYARLGRLWGLGKK